MLSPMTNGAYRCVVEKADKRRLEELRVEVAVKESFKKKLVIRRLKWVGLVERMAEILKMAECGFPDSGGKRV